MGNQKRKLIIFSVALALIPFTYILADDNESQPATALGNILNPDKLFDALKQNVTIPISGDKDINLPSATEALESVSPKLQEINTDVNEETGINLSKFISWFAKILKAFFQFIVNLLERMSEALKS